MKHVLVVEDDGGVCELLTMALAGDGYRVTCCSRGIDALWHIEHDRPDLVIGDVGLPDMSGVRLAKRATEAGVTVLLITGHGDAATMLRGSACPMLAKPFRVADLLARVRALAIDGAQHTLHVKSALERVNDAAT